MVIYIYFQRTNTELYLQLLITRYRNTKLTTQENARVIHKFRFIESLLVLGEGGVWLIFMVGTVMRVKKREFFPLMVYGGDEVMEMIISRGILWWCVCFRAINSYVKNLKQHLRLCKAIYTCVIFANNIKSRLNTK